MKIKSIFALAIWVFLAVSCGTETNSDNKDKTESGVISSERTVTENTNETTTNNQTDNTVNNQNSENTNQMIFEGEFKEGLPLDQTFYYIFKDKNGNELTIFHDPANNQNVSYTLVGTDLQANPEFVGKKFKITYTKLERVNENTGEPETVNIPAKIELLK